MHQAYKLLLIYFNIFSLFPQVLSIVGGRKAALPPTDDPVVFVNHVGRFSRVQGFHNPRTNLYVFRGIKYADPPVRENRFLRPKLKRMSGDISALYNSPPCPQPDFYDEKKIVGNEDCLALNIFTPQMPDETTGLPVLIWIHGGGYRYGSAAQYDAEPLVQDKIIFVPIAYRLGTLGILGDGSKEFGGNVALFDMHAALQWVKEYISFFGGDPKQIKVIGHGSGGAAAMYVSSSPMGRSSLNGVIAMSGSSLSQYSYDENATTSTEEIAKAHNCPYKNEISLVNCMRNKTFDEIIEKDSKLQVERLMGQNMIKSMNGMLSFAPNIEGKDDQRGLPGIITQKPQDYLKNEPEKKIPLLSGNVRHETANGIKVDEILKIFKSGTDFLKATAASLQLDLLNAPQKITGALGIIGLPTLDDYLKVPDGLNPDKLLEKLIESTTDVFFNLPLVLSADLWGKFASAFVYQFDYVGESGESGKQLLKPLPLVSKGSSKAMVAHGDELGFLFEINDVFGNRINKTLPKSARDQIASKNFIEVIQKFAYFNSNVTELKIGNVILNPFRSSASNFIKISESLGFEKDFRFCQLSLWGAPLQASQKISCEFLSEGLKKLPSLSKVKDVGGIMGGNKFGFV